MSKYSLEEKIEQMVYERLCSCCPKAHRCHELCENCDEFYEEFEEETEKAKHEGC